MEHPVSYTHLDVYKRQGEEFSDFIDIARIGGIIVKGTTLHKREGNPYPLSLIHILFEDYLKGELV